MPHGSSLGAHVQFPWESVPNSFGANIAESLGPAAAGSTESQQSMGSYYQTSILKQDKIVTLRKCKR